MLLANDATLNGAVGITFDDFAPWFKLSGTPFFPGFTAHDIGHVAEVITTAGSLISDEAWNQLTPGDAAVLALAALLHDSAMHLTEDGFRSLVLSNPDDLPRIEGFGDRPWATLWREFLSEASRFDGRRLVSIFGDSTPVDPRRVDVTNLSERDRLLVGEFVRRHHARLAHEIAVFGVPGPTRDRLTLRAPEKDLADIAGVIARSHGLPMRDTFTYLADKYSLREYKGIHAVFLMTVLRIADYLQVHAERAPEELLRIRTLRSPVSVREWAGHAAVRDIRGTHEDPEALFIDAIPSDVHTFLKLKHLFADIQRELDVSWATLGETYGRFGALRDLGLTIRRIRSSLDDVTAFQRKVDYLPVAAAFDSAGTDLLRLLVGPLYGDARGVAVRELVQNGVDACRELEDWIVQHSLPRPTGYVQDVDVTVRFVEREDKSRYVEITDNGIGMTADVVRHYFLRAGASFRYSEAWRKQHEDASGKPRVLRGGRFGVGALAAFLVGRTLRVTTRHVSEPPDAAITFEASLESDAIELKRTKAPVGTRIVIPIEDPDAWMGLTPGPATLEEARRSGKKDVEWSQVDWYCLPTPSVRVTLEAPTSNVTLRQSHNLPVCGTPLDGRWLRIAVPDYDDVQWSYEGRPKLACNGIVVPKAFEEGGRYWQSPPEEDVWLARASPIPLIRPSLSIFDSRGILPVNLQRTAVSARAVSFDRELAAAVARNYVAYCVALTPDDPTSAAADDLFSSIATFPGIFNQWGASAPIVATRQGVMLLDGPLINAQPYLRFRCLARLQHIPAELYGTMADTDCVAFLMREPSQLDLARIAFGGPGYAPRGGLQFLEAVHARLLVSDSARDAIMTPGRVNRAIVKTLQTEWSQAGFCVLARQMRNAKARFSVDSLVSAVGWDGTRPTVTPVIEWELATPGWDPRRWIWQSSAFSEVPPTQLCAAWLELIPGRIVPYDPGERAKLVAAMPSEIKERVAYYAKRPKIYKRLDRNAPNGDDPQLAMPTGEA